MLPDVANPPEEAPHKEPKVVPPVLEDEPVVPPATIPPVPPKEIKTPPNELLAALHEERRLRKEAEATIKTLQSSSVIPTIPVEDMSDEGKELSKKINTLESELGSMKMERELTAVFAQFPVLIGKEAEFETFRATKQGYSLTDAARLFIAENSLTPEKPARKGLEKGTGGNKTPTPAGKVTAAEFDRLRTTQPRLFAQMIRDGRLNPDEIV